jgi:predicted phage terminase large subunit-like protein
VMTRWHEQDLGGQLGSQNGEPWDVLRLPAVAEENDPLGRPQGAPLWPEWEGLNALNRKQTVVGDRTWSALFQQAPRNAGARLFDTSKLRFVEGLPSFGTAAERAVRAWDLAATAPSGDGDPDWTAGVKLYQTASGQYIIDDIVRLRGNFYTVQETLIATAAADGQNVVISLPIDPGQAGKSQAAQLSSKLAGFRLYTSREHGSKLSRAIPVAAQLDAGNLTMRKGLWNQVLLEELQSFPQGKKDDQVDALSRAFLTLCDFPGKIRRVDIPFNIR